MKKIVLLITVIFVLFAFSLTLQKNNQESQVLVKGQTVLDAPVTDDTYTLSTSPNTVTGPNHEMIFDNYNGEISKIYLKFAINLPSNATIDSAYLRLYRNDCSGLPSPTTFTIASIVEDWHENLITWNNAPAQGTQTSASITCGAVQEYTNYSVKSVIESQKQSGKYYGFKIYGPKNGSWYRTFATKEGGANKAPKLVIYYTVPDGASSAPSTGTSSVTQGTTTSGTNRPSNSSSDTQTSNTESPKSSSGFPTKAELEALINDFSGGAEGMNFWDKLFASWFYIGPIIGFLFWALIIGLIVLLVHRHNKKKLASGTVKKDPVNNLASGSNPPVGESKGAVEEKPDSTPVEKKVDTLTKPKGK